MTGKLEDFSFGAQMIDYAGVVALIGNKQDKLTAGTGISIVGNVISATGAGIVIDSEMSDTSENPVQNKVISAALALLNTALGGKQATLSAGAGITIDGTTISATGISVVIDTEMSSTSTHPVQNRVITQALAGKQATLTAGTGITITGNTISATATPITVDAALSNTSENPVQNKVIYEALQGKQGTLTAGTGISISGNTISATGGGSITVDDAMSSTSTNPVQNSVITAALSGKQATLTAGAGISIVGTTISATGGGSSQLIEAEGYMKDGVLYSDVAMTTAITPVAYKIYYDILGTQFYQYLNSNYVALPFASTNYVFNAMQDLEQDIVTAQALASSILNTPVT